MNNFRRSIEEIVQVVKIADTTLKKRLEEFRKTPSGSLTLADFRTVWLDEEMDPPAFTEGKDKEERERDMASGNVSIQPIEKKKKKRKKRVDSDESEAENMNPPPPETNMPMIDPALFNQGILVGTIAPPPLFYPDEEDAELSNIDPALRQPGVAPPTATEPQSQLEENVNQALTEEVSNFLQNSQGSSLSAALQEAEERRLAQFTEVDELMNLDEDELDGFILSEDEVRLKERIWVEMNREYLEALAAKAEQLEKGTTTVKTRKRRKTNTKPRDASTPSGSTAAESVQNLIKKNSRYSKRINYDALKNLFVDQGSGSGFDNKDDDLYSMDEKDDNEGMIVIEEGGGVVGTKSQQTSRHGKVNVRDDTDDQDAHANDEDGDASDKGDEDEVIDTGWEDAYEQEV